LRERCAGFAEEEKELKSRAFCPVQEKTRYNREKITEPRKHGKGDKVIEEKGECWEGGVTRLICDRTEKDDFKEEEARHS